MTNFFLQTIYAELNKTTNPENKYEGAGELYGPDKPRNIASVGHQVGRVLTVE